MKPALPFVIALPLLLICLPAQAYQLESGAVMICDTQKQVERFAQLFDGDPQVALSTVNSEQHTPNACATVDATYAAGVEIAVVRSGSRTFRIVPVMLLAADTATGYRTFEPTLFFTAVQVEEYAV